MNSFTFRLISKASSLLPNHADEEIIGVADVLEPTVIWVEGLKIGDGLAFQFHPAKFLGNAFPLLRVLGFPQFFAEPGSIPGVVIGQKCGLSLFAPVKLAFSCSIYQSSLSR